MKATLIVLLGLWVVGCGERGVDMEPDTSSLMSYGTGADKAIQRFLETEHNETPHAYAYIAYAVALRRGWEDPRVAQLLERVYGMENPDGGYGLGFAWDNYGDGTVNPAHTSYVVTVADHVGMVFLEGWKAGIVPRERVERLIEFIMAVPPADTLGPGLCIAESRDPNDRYPAIRLPCTHNVNAGAGLFLAHAQAYGIQRPGMDERIALITQREVASYLSDEKTWRYWDGTSRRNDFNHEGYQVEAMLELAPAIGREAGRSLMQKRAYEYWYDVLGQVRILPYFCDYTPELLNAFWNALDHPEQVPRYLAQAAVWAARTAMGCASD